VLAELQEQADPANAAGMARFGIVGARVLGIPMAYLRPLARRLGRDHDLAAALWASGVHEARLLATLVAEPARLSREQAEAWAAEVDSWDLCDQLCANLLRRWPDAVALAHDWSERPEEFVKRAGFALMVSLVQKEKRLSDDELRRFLAAVEREAGDQRNYVRKALSWVLRELGKKRPSLSGEAIAAAERIRETKSRWLGSDALRELRRRQADGEEDTRGKVSRVSPERR